jgi:hypothetical protein
VRFKRDGDGVGLHGFGVFTQLFLDEAETVMPRGYARVQQRGFLEERGRFRKLPKVEVGMPKAKLQLGIDLRCALEQNGIGRYGGLPLVPLFKLEGLLHGGLFGGHKDAA